jgi:hypothetical protein
MLVAMGGVNGGSSILFNAEAEDLAVVSAADLSEVKADAGTRLLKSADGREFSIDLIPTVGDGDDGSSIRLETLTRGTENRRDGNLPIWDGQTVMILLGDSGDKKDKRQLAAFVTVRLVGGDGESVHDFMVK